MKRIILCLSLFSFFGSQAQQINPVPDYVFSNKMSVGRNAVTDTAAYFSIGPRYGAIRGMMPPMVTDTASMSANKRNGLLIFSIQKNKYLYWDSVGSKWAEMAGTTGSALTSGDTASMLSPYIRAAGNGLTKSGQSLLVDTLTISTRAWRRKGLDSLAALELSISDTASMLTPYTRGSGTTNYLPKFTGTRTFGNSVAFDNGGTELLVNTTSDAGAYALQVAGAAYVAGTLAINTNGDTRIISTNKASGSFGENMFIGTSGTLLSYTSGADGSYNNSFGLNSLGSITRGYSNNAFGNGSLLSLTTGAENNCFGFRSGYFITTGGMNVAMGHNSLGTASTVVGSVAIGERAMGDGATTGSYNVGVGSSALRNVTSGALNTGIGLGTLRNITTGNYLVALGAEAGRYLNNASNNVTSSNSVYVGYNTRASADGNTNENVFGNDARGNGSNTTTIGNTSTVGTYFPSGEMYVNTTTDAGAYALQVSGAIYNTTTITTGAPTGGSIKPWRLGEAATVSPTSPNRTIRVEIDGTVYYIHAKTTND